MFCVLKSACVLTGRPPIAWGPASVRALETIKLCKITRCASQYSGSVVWWCGGSVVVVVVTCWHHVLCTGLCCGLLTQREFRVFHIISSERSAA